MGMPAALEAVLGSLAATRSDQDDAAPETPALAAAL